MRRQKIKDAFLCDNLLLYYVILLCADNTNSSLLFVKHLLNPEHLENAHCEFAMTKVRFCQDTHTHIHTRVLKGTGKTELIDE